jgi:two-component system, NtrC family, C4-dicarboxylate transport response regulator DctD
MLFDTDQQVIFIEDDEALRIATIQTLELAGLKVRAFASADAAIVEISPDFGGVIVSDIRMRGMDGLQMFARVRAIDPDIPVILVTGHADVGMAIGALSGGAFDFLTKPFAGDHLIASIRRALETRLLVLDNRRLRALAEAQEDMGPLIGDSSAIAHLRATIRKLAALDFDVLIEGETGTGKDLVARLLHRHGKRRNQAFVTVNCGALEEGFAEAELFGDASFRTAQRRSPRLGQIETANRGVLYLDDIDSMSLRVQARLLGLLDQRDSEPGGSTYPRPPDMRVIATSKVELGKLVQEGRFRSDLLYRLNTVRLRLPPLRERREDIPALFAFFIAEARAQLGTREFKLSDKARRDLTSHDWPGNARELKNYAVKEVLGLTDGPDQNPNSSQLPLNERVRRFEAWVIEEALRSTRGNVTAAQAILGVPRKTLYEKMTRLSIEAARFRHKKDLRGYDQD